MIIFTICYLSLVPSLPCPGFVAQAWRKSLSLICFPWLCDEILLRKAGVATWLLHDPDVLSPFHAGPLNSITPCPIVQNTPSSFLYQSNPACSVKFNQPYSINCIRYVCVNIGMPLRSLIVVSPTCPMAVWLSHFRYIISIFSLCHTLAEGQGGVTPIECIVTTATAGQNLDQLFLAL